MNMEIQPNKGASLPQEIKAASQAPPKQPIPQDTYAGQAADAIQQGFASDDELRPHVVAQGKEYMADTHYPPIEIVRKIARLIAIDVNSEE